MLSFKYLIVSMVTGTSLANAPHNLIPVGIKSMI